MGIEMVSLAYKQFVFTDERQPITVPNVVSIEKSQNGMQEILVTKTGETATVELRGLRMTVVKPAVEDAPQANEGADVQA